VLEEQGRQPARQLAAGVIHRKGALMNMHPSRRHQESSAALDQRVLVLEDCVAALTEALRVLAHGLEDLPAAEPGGRRAAEAARQAYDLLLVAGQHSREPDRRPGA
jgi:hypothetical protein